MMAKRWMSSQRIRWAMGKPGKGRGKCIWRTGNAFTHNVRWVQGTLSTRSRWLTGTGARWAIVVRRQEYEWDFIAPYISHMLGPMKSCFIFPFILILMSGFSFCFLWWKTLVGPWSTVWWEVRAYCQAFPCIVFNLERAWGSSDCSLGHFQINYPRLSTYNMSPHGTSSLEMGMVLCSQLDIRWSFSCYYILWTLSFWDPIRDQLLDYVLMVVQDWDSICTTEDVLFSTLVCIIWYWLSFNAQRGK